jgi:hypothetical protein
MQQHKIPISAIPDAQRVLENAPVCNTTEVTKVDAMRLLLPQIKAMQAKGYGLAHIAKLLSETGISLTEVTLKNYVHRLRVQTEKASSRRRKQTGPLERTTLEAAERKPGTKPNLSGDSPSLPASPRRESAGSPAAAAAPAGPGTSSGSMELPRRVVSPSLEDSGARRAGFTVRPDTKDI